MTDEEVIFATDNFYVKTESDRDVFPRGADAEDRVYVYAAAGSRKKFRLDFENVKAPVFFGTNNRNFEWIEAKKYDIPPTEGAIKFYRGSDKKKKYRFGRMRLCSFIAIQNIRGCKV